jgi:uncharacterized protein YjeT (DUF2065 family)
MGDVLWMALALVLVIEGLLPFFNPAAWRKVFSQVMLMTDGQLRFMGLMCILSGLLLLWCVA